MSPIFIILSGVYIIFSVALVSAILLQKKRSAGGMGSIAGMGNVADTYWDKNKARTQEGQLERWTKVGAVVLCIMSVVLCLV